MDVFKNLAESVRGRINATLEENRITQNQVASGDKPAQKRINSQLSHGSAITLDTVLRILEAFPDVSADWLLRGTEDKESDTAIESTAETKPRIPSSAFAGRLSGFADAVTEENCESVPVVKRFPKYDYTIIVRGDSMEPKFEAGDELAIQRVEEIREGGIPYVLDTKDGAVLKKVYDEGDKYRCVSYNSEYSDFTVDKTSVHAVYKVVGLIRI